MKKLLLCLVAAMLTLYLSQAQGSWHIVNSPVDENLISICFIDTDHGWIISETGTIISTSNSGITWETISYPDVHFESVHFSDNDHGCIVGWQETPADSSLIMLTSDGGNTWSIVDHVRVNRLNDVFFINNNIGWAVGSYDDWNLNCCLYTSDGGQNWDKQSSISVVGAELYGVCFRDENLGQVCGADGAFFITNNGGTQSWAMGISMPILNLNAIYNWGALTGCTVGDEGTALYTINNWYQYIETVTNTTENLNGVSGDPVTNKLWAVGENGTIIYTSYYVLGWMEQTSGVTEHLNDVQMINESNGWAVGDNGTILHYSLETAIRHRDESWIEIFPNPVDNLLYIHMDSPVTFDLIQIINSNGTLVAQKKIENCFETTIDVSNLAPGIYHLKIIGDSETIIKKVLIK
jgi:photosystem II stability/assembly factor-like uncharacterized protein